MGAGVQLADFGLSPRNSRSWHSIADSPSSRNSNRLGATADDTFFLDIWIQFFCLKPRTEESEIVYSTRPSHISPAQTMRSSPQTMGQKAPGCCPVLLAHRAEANASLLIAEFENDRALHYKKLLRSMTADVGNIDFELLAVRLALRASERARVRAETELISVRERCSIQMRTFIDEAALFRVEVDGLRQRAEAAENLCHRLEVGVSNIICAIAGVAVPGLDLGASSQEHISCGYHHDKQILPRLQSSGVGRTNASEMSYPLLGLLRKELGDARVTTDAAIADLHNTRAVTSAANRRVYLAKISTVIALDRATVSEKAARAERDKASQAQQYKVKVLQGLGLAADAMASCATAASGATIAALAATQAAHTATNRRIIDSEKAKHAAEVAFTSNAVACWQANSRVFLMERNVVADAAVIVSIQSLSSANAAVVLSVSVLSEVIVASSIAANKCLSSIVVARAEHCIALAERVNLTSSYAAHVCSVRDKVASKLTTVNLRRAVLAETSTCASICERDHAIIEATVSRTLLAKLHAASDVHSKVADISLHFLVQRLSEFRTRFESCVAGWCQKLVEVQQKLQALEVQNSCSAMLLREKICTLLDRIASAETNTVTTNVQREKGKSKSLRHQHQLRMLC